MYGFLNVSILTLSQIKKKSKPYAAEAVFFSKYILNNSHNDQRTAPPPRRVKLNHKPTATASQTIRLPSHTTFTSPNQMACKRLDTQCGRWGGGWSKSEAMAQLHCLVVSPESYAAVVSIMHFAVQFNLLSYTSDRGVAMKNRNKAHFTVVYIFCFLFVIVC